MTGMELLEALRADPSLKSVPFIMISAKAGDEARLDTLAKGADDYLAKPFQARELLLRVHAQLQSTSVRIDLEQRVNEHSRDLEESQKSFVSLCVTPSVSLRAAPTSGTGASGCKWASIGPTRRYVLRRASASASRLTMRRARSHGVTASGQTRSG
jgi:YesN/AraC family two-component response regulator